jgi:hypothetical protein
MDLRMLSTNGEINNWAFRCLACCMRRLAADDAAEEREERHGRPIPAAAPLEDKLEHLLEPIIGVLVAPRVSRCARDSHAHLLRRCFPRVARATTR